METSLSNIKTYYSFSCLSMPRNKHFAQQLSVGNRGSKLRPHRRWQQDGRFGGGVVVECAKSAPVPESEGGLEKEMNAEEAEEWAGIVGRMREKCKEGRGMGELMECLEREAIMGEAAEGREPTDYSRRAHIFDKSSRVFQALKESKTTAPHES